MPEREPGSPCPTPPELGDYVRDAEFPASKRDLVDHVEQVGAPQDVRQTIEALGTRDFDSVDALEEAVRELSR